MPNLDSRRSSTSTENDVFAIDDTFVPPPQQKIAGINEISFENLLTIPLLLHEDLKEGCGGQLWPAGMLLSKYMLIYHKHDLADKVM